MRTTNLLATLLLVGLAVSTVPLAAAQHGAFNCYYKFGPDFDLLCPPPTVNGASCVSHGLLVMERDLTGLVGDVTVDHSQSRVFTWANEGQWPPFQREGVRPPGDPQAHADAHQLGVSYVNPALGLSVSTKTVFSQCDVVALFDPNMGLYTEAYGRGGAEDLEIALPLGTIGAEVLDWEISAFGFPWSTYAFQACDVVELQLLGPAVSRCPTQNAGVALGTFFAGVSVTVNENWGPVWNSAGQWVYGGAALHVEVTTATTIVDVYVGYVAVAVTGGPPFPAFCWPDPSLPGNCVVPFP